MDINHQNTIRLKAVLIILFIVLIIISATVINFAYNLAG